MNRRRRKTQSRQRNSRPVKTRVLIVCEGQETERNYFDQLKREDRVTERFSVTVKKGKGGSREQIAQHAIDRMKNSIGNFDEVWCVMDVEGPSHRESLDRAQAMLRKEGISLCLSNPAFEIWFLAHFEKSGAPFRDCEAVKVVLDKHWRSAFAAEYQKNDKDIFHKLAPMTETALANAKWGREHHHEEVKNTCDCNSSTDVYFLVGNLKGNQSNSSAAR